jgi:hypothetical protein
MTSMNRFNFLAAIIVALSLPSCQDTKQDLRDPLSEKDVYKTIGEQIPFETGMEWIEFYNKKRYEQARLDLSASFNVPAPQMESLLKSATDLVGVAFHYAIDDLGQSHILVIPVDESMTLWSDISGRIMVDANTGNQISQDIASQWAQRYKDAYADEIWFHFFGKDVFDEMVALPFFNSVDIEPAINVLDLTAELLLVVPNDDEISLGRTASSDGVVYDASNPCPPCAVE